MPFNACPARQPKSSGKDDQTAAQRPQLQQQHEHSLTHRTVTLDITDEELEELNRRESQQVRWQREPQRDETRKRLIWELKEADKVR